MDSLGRPTGWGGVVVARPDLATIQAAAKLLRGGLVHTPLIPLQCCDGSEDLLLKPETLQPIGSFKLRGALTWALGLSQEQRQRGFSTHSAGNTALALGHVARLCGVSARSLLPDRTPPNKIEAIQRYGVMPVIMPFDELLDFIFRAGWNDEPYSYLNPWADPQMIAGNGTIGLEICADLPDVDTVYVPVGGGGLIAGVGSAVKAVKPRVRVVAVQPSACPALKASLEAGKPLWIEAQPTICDTALPLVVDELFPLLQQVVDDVVLVSDEAVKQVVARLAMGNKLVVEAAGALSVAAALATPVEQRGKSVCILSGGSIGAARLIEIIRENQTP